MSKASVLFALGLILLVGTFVLACSGQVIGAAISGRYGLRLVRIGLTDGVSEWAQLRMRTQAVERVIEELSSRRFFHLWHGLEPPPGRARPPDA
jgi:hypothetical protein